MSSTPTPRPGRGALSNPEGRFESRRVSAVDDGWPRDPEADELPPLETTVRPEHAKKVITRNDSPDIAFEQSINPYRGCEHGCVYCAGPDTQVLMADGTTRALADIRTGDAIYGTERHGHYRRYVRTSVLAHWETEKPAYRITLQDGTELIASGDHRFLTLRGWKFVIGSECGRDRRPHLTTNDELLGVGGGMPGQSVRHSAYKRGYLCGMIRGDGHLATHAYLRVGGCPGELHQFRLALIDLAGIDRTATYLEHFGVPTRRFTFVNDHGTTRHLHAIRTHRRSDVDCIRRFVAWPSTATSEWSRGFLAGIFDAEGSYSGGVLRISNTDPAIIDATSRSLRELGFNIVAEHVRRSRIRPITVIRVRGGLKEHLRFFHTMDPAILRKRNIEMQALKSSARLQVVSIEPIGRKALFDVTTGTGDFMANGVVSHNCYARPSHSYVNLSPGLDFETKLFYKAHAAQLLETELARPGYVCKPINLGANTDPYQPIERKLRVTRSILEVLQRHRHPLTIVTKSALIERDLDILTEMARDDLVMAFVSVTTLDAALKRKLEPRAPSPAARLHAVRALREAGVPVGVLVAPVIPAVTDHEIEHILEAVAEAGAQTAGYVLIRLPYELKTLFREWLDAHLPERAEHVMSLIRATRNGLENDPRFGSRMRGEGPYAELIARRFETAARRLGLQRQRGSRLSTRHFRPYLSAGNQLTLL